MRIACPQCSMQYDLDPRLLPPAGASVQCTRCSFVFTAMPSGQVLTPNQPQGAQGRLPPRAGDSSRSALGTSTQVFGSPYAAQGKPSALAPTTTQVFGAVQPPGPVETLAATPVASPAVGKTLVFGAVPMPEKAPSASTTQVFGAASVPAPLPSAATTQVFGAPSIPSKAAAPSSAPSASTTQVFGAVPMPAQPAPSASTTQVFGAAAVASKAPAPATTQVFGAVPTPTQPPTPVTTQTFGAAEVEAARKASRSPAPAPAAPGESVPWMVEPGPTSAPRGVTAERQAASPPAPALSLPEEPVALPAPPLPSFPQEPAVERSGPIVGSRRGAALELPPEMLGPSPADSSRPPPAQASGGGKERILLVLGAVVALGLTAWLSYPVWRNQGAELPAEALSAKDQAVSLLRRDDAASREQAIEQLRTLVARFPKFTEAQAELVVALSLQLDGVKVDLEWISQEEARIQKEISNLELAKSPVDWSSRVNARRQELAALGEQKRPLDAKVVELTKQLEPGLGYIRAAPETEPSADVVARVKAQAVHAGIQGHPQAISLAERLRQVESPAHWSVLTRVEYGLNAPSPPSALPELAEALARVREQDKTFLRAYVLGARLALRLKDGATARSLLDTVVALNPNHALARKLQIQAATVAPAP